MVPIQRYETMPHPTAMLHATTRRLATQKSVNGSHEVMTLPPLVVLFMSSLLHAMYNMHNAPSLLPTDIVLQARRQFAVGPHRRRSKGLPSWANRANRSRQH